MKKSSNPRVFPLVELLRWAVVKRRFYGLVGTQPTVRFAATLLFLCGSTFFLSCKKDHQEQPAVERELNQLRAAVAAYGNIQHGIAAGYTTEVTGYRKHMGFHYINASLLDDKFELTKPELLLYAPYGNDSLKFVAVEYAVPIDDLNNPPPVPEGFTGDSDVWEINTEFKLWTLHVWVGLDNPHGIFAPHNSKLP